MSAPVPLFREDPLRYAYEALLVIERQLLEAEIMLLRAMLQQEGDERERLVRTAKVSLTETVSRTRALRDLIRPTLGEVV